MWLIAILALAAALSSSARSRSSIEHHTLSADAAADRVGHGALVHEINVAPERLLEALLDLHPRGDPELDARPAERPPGGVE